MTAQLSFGRQPILWLNVAGLAISLAVSFGLSLSQEQTAAIMALLQAVAAAIGWTQVTPVKDPRLPPDAVLEIVTRPDHVPSPGNPPVE